MPKTNFSEIVSILYPFWSTQIDPSQPHFWYAQTVVKCQLYCIYLFSQNCINGTRGASYIDILYKYMFKQIVFKFCNSKLNTNSVFLFLLNRRYIHELHAWDCFFSTNILIFFWSCNLFVHQKNNHPWNLKVVQRKMEDLVRYRTISKNSDKHIKSCLGQNDYGETDYKDRNKSR